MNEEQKTFFSDSNFSCFKMFSSFLVFMDEYMKRHLVVHVFHAYVFFCVFFFNFISLRCHAYALGMVREYLCLDRPSVGGKHDDDTM